MRLVGWLFRHVPHLSVAHMDEERLRRVQELVVPDRGPAAWLASVGLGRAHRSVDISTRSFPARHGDLPLRLYRPRAARGPLPVVVAFHGGGFSLGNARQGDWWCSAVAAGARVLVVAVDYRLAPTHRFPAAVEDCVDALRWTAGHAGSLGGDASRLAVMGDSAGGNLAAVAALQARDDGGPVLRHQVLVYPATDLTEELRAHASYVANTTAYVLSNEDLGVFADHYVGDGADRADWRLSPLHAPDLSGLPPATVVVAGLDPLHDSGVRYAEALAAAGVPVRVEEFHRMPHGFLGFPYVARDARAGVAAVVRALDAALHG